MQEQVRAAYTCLTKGKAAASRTWLGDARSMRAYYLLELWVHRRGVCAYTATFERLRDVLHETYKTAHAVSRMGIYFEYKSFEDARAYVHPLGLKSVEEWRKWIGSGARPHDIPSHPYTTYASSGWLSLGDFLGYAGGKVTGAYKRNAAVAGLRALQNDADNDEKDEQDDDDDDARRRKQAKRPRGG